jgi:phosphoglycerol transferase MdoB-like AlkP superfamily enzyme
MYMWDKFYLSFKQDLRLWFYCIVLQQSCRIFYLISLHKYIAVETSILDIAACMLHGLRFDSLWATVVILCSLVLSRVISRKVQAFIFTLCTIIIYIISVEYYKEYHGIFNQFLFGLLYDDSIAIFSTIWSAGYVLKYTILTVFGVLIFSYIFNKMELLENTNTNINILTHKNIHAKYKILIFIGIIIFYIGAFRGGLGARPIQEKDAGVTKDQFLNKAVISPYSALKYAIKEHNNINAENSRFKHLSIDTILVIAKNRFGIKLSGSSNRLDNYWLKHANAEHANKMQHPPKHIFVIVGESYDAWALQDTYSDLNLTNEVKQIAKQGISLQSFLPASHGTMTSLNTIISGLPDTGVMTNYQVNSAKLYPTAPAGHFKQLGYKTNFFYGGYLSWQKIAEFAKNQGFDCIYGAPNIDTWVTATEWGVDDRSLFTFILQTIDNNTPSYNLIMTTSNHPPFSINLAQEGFNIDVLERKLLKKFPDSPTTAKKLGHLWYSDQTIGSFIQQAETLLSQTLFVITGDHYGRRHVLPNPPIFDSVAVPFILYGKGITDVLQFPANMAGSHLDIGATLIELSAPYGFAYYSMGKNLLADKINTDSIYGISKNFIVTADKIINISTENCSKTDNEIAIYCKYYDDLVTLSWWRISKGEAG